MATKKFNPDDFDFASGSAEIEVEAAKNRTDYDRARPKLLKFTESEAKHIVRFLDDDKRNPNDRRKNLWKGIQQHGYIKTVPKPKSFKGQSWPEGMTAVCRNDKAFGDYFDGCLPCDQNIPKPDGKDGSAQLRMFARVVLRERTRWEDEDGKTRQGVVDKLVEVNELDADGKQTGKKIQIPDIRYVEQSRRAFFQHLIGIAQAAMEDADDEDAYTLLDRDYTIQRNGFGASDTSYAINEVRNSDKLVGDEGTTVEIDGETVDLEGVVWDVNDPRVLAYYEQFLLWSLPSFFVDQASDEHHERWFLPGGYDKWSSDSSNDDEEEEKPRKSRSSRKAAARDDEDEEEEKPTRRRRPAAQKDEDDEEEAKPTRRRPARDQDDDEEERPRARRRPAPVEDDDDEGEDDAPSTSSRLSKHRAAMKAEKETPARQRADSSDVDEDEEEFEKV